MNASYKKVSNVQIMLFIQYAKDRHRPVTEPFHDSLSRNLSENVTLSIKGNSYLDICRIRGNLIDLNIFIKEGGKYLFRYMWTESVIT